jgi:hypothetical protein
MVNRTEVNTTDEVVQNLEKEKENVLGRLARGTFGHIAALGLKVILELTIESMHVLSRPSYLWQDDIVQLGTALIYDMSMGSGTNAVVVNPHLVQRGAMTFVPAGTAKTYYTLCHLGPENNGHWALFQFEKEQRTVTVIETNSNYSGALKQSLAKQIIAGIGWGCVDVQLMPSRKSARHSQSQSPSQSQPLGDDFSLSTKDVPVAKGKAHVCGPVVLIELYTAVCQKLGLQQKDWLESGDNWNLRVVALRMLCKGLLTVLPKASSEHDNWKGKERVARALYELPKNLFNGQVLPNVNLGGSCYCYDVPDECMVVGLCCQRRWHVKCFLNVMYQKESGEGGDSQVFGDAFTCPSCFGCFQFVAVVCSSLLGTVKIHNYPQPGVGGYGRVKVSNKRRMFANKLASKFGAGCTVWPEREDHLAGTVRAREEEPGPRRVRRRSDGGEDRQVVQPSPEECRRLREERVLVNSGQAPRPEGIPEEVSLRSIRSEVSDVPFSTPSPNSDLPADWEAACEAGCQRRRAGSGIVQLKDVPIRH